MAQLPIIIAGAGITGLVLAQALKKHDIPFVILERDPDPLFRGKGWGITIHWALDALLELLPQHLIDRLPEAYVDGEATKNGENGNFLFFNLKTGEALWQVPPAKRIRMGREKFRRLLMADIPIQWGHSFKSFEASDSGPVKATFTTTDGSCRIIEGSMVVGCDGSRSRVRNALFPDPAVNKNYQLPIRLLGASTIYSGSFTAAVRALDPFFFQGGHPDTDAAHWFSFLDSPSTSGRGDDSRECQILVSWPHRRGFMGHDQPLETPVEDRDRVALMKQISDNWADPFRSIVHAIPDDADIKPISLEDWVPPREHWNEVPGSGRVVLVGDSAHAMTMYRGEAANHGITDVHVLLSEILPILSFDSVDDKNLKEACDRYTQRMVDRTAPAVMNSRQACLDAHVYKNINDDSPLIFKRAAVRPQEKAHKQAVVV